MEIITKRGTWSEVRSHKGAVIGSLYGMWFISHEQDSKMLLVSTPRRKTGLFSQIAPPDETHEKLKICSTAQVRIKLMFDSFLL